MEILEIKQKKLIASEGKDIVLKDNQYDENGNLLPKDRMKMVYLAINDDENNYEEINEVINENIE